MTRPDEPAYQGNIFGDPLPKRLNKNLHRAKRNKNDEFYTQIDDIERELRHYRAHFKDKIVFCNCDDPDWSAFTRYFALNFEFLGLKKVISTHYEEGNTSYKMEITHQVKDTEEISTLPRVPLSGDGDFRSEECIELLRESDIVCTNPPFSLFREYIAQLIAHEKKFLIIGNMNAISYKEIFPLMRNNLLWFGPSISSGDREFRVPDSYPLVAAGCRVDAEGNKYIRVKGVRWFTNLSHKKRNEELILVRKYKGNENYYPHYDNYDVINVDKTKEIPADYKGAMGVPITFMDKYNPKQFEILSSNDYRTNDGVPFKEHGLIKDKDGAIDGKPKYARIVIRRRDAN